MAIDQIYVWNNTSIMQDEVLCHRLGLLPLNIDPKRMKDRRNKNQPHESDTMIFDLRVRCDRIPGHDKDETDPRKMYYDSSVYSGMMEWVPQGDQERKFSVKRPGPVDQDILLVKLRPGQVGTLSEFGSELTIDGRLPLFREEGYGRRARQVVSRRYAYSHST